MWVRGSRHDYDHWTQNGAEGWSYVDVLPYFIRIEDSRAKNVDLGKHYHHIFLFPTNNKLRILLVNKSQQKCVRRLPRIPWPNKSNRR